MTVDVTVIWKAVADPRGAERANALLGVWQRILRADMESMGRAEEGYEEESGREDRELFVELVHGLKGYCARVMLSCCRSTSANSDVTFLSC